MKMKRLLEEGGSEFCQALAKKICDHVGKVDELETENRRLKRLLREHADDIYFCQYCERLLYDENVGFCDFCTDCYCNEETFHELFLKETTCCGVMYCLFHFQDENVNECLKKCRWKK